MGGLKDVLLQKKVSVNIQGDMYKNGEEVEIVGNIYENQNLI